MVEEMVDGKWKRYSEQRSGCWIWWFVWDTESRTLCWEWKMLNKGGGGARLIFKNKDHE